MYLDIHALIVNTAWQMAHWPVFRWPRKKLSVDDGGNVTDL